MQLLCLPLLHHASQGCFAAPFTLDRWSPVSSKPQASGTQKCCLCARLNMGSGVKRSRLKDRRGGQQLQSGAGCGLGMQESSIVAKLCPWHCPVVASLESHGIRTPSLPTLSVDHLPHRTPRSSANRAAREGYITNNTNYCYMLATRYTGSNGIQGDETKAV